MAGFLLIVTGDDHMMLRSNGFQDANWRWWLVSTESDLRHKISKAAGRVRTRRGG